MFAFLGNSPVLIKGPVLFPKIGYIVQRGGWGVITNYPSTCLPNRVSFFFLYYSFRLLLLLLCISVLFFFSVFFPFLSSSSHDFWHSYQTWMLILDWEHRIFINFLELELILWWPRSTLYFSPLVCEECWFEPRNGVCRLFIMGEKSIEKLYKQSNNWKCNIVSWFRWSCST